MMLTIVLVLVLSQHSWACKCIPPDAVRDYCEKGFFGVITVKQGPYSCGEHSNCYNVCTDWEIKGGVATNITTPSTSAACGQELEVGSTYLIGGDLQTESATIRTTSCNYKQALTSWSCSSISDRVDYFQGVDC
ncbi:hypothetical protein HDE_08605 [Halotydeus destructor]|nr:hypothetical protein HDE_08605 [Halotydeus destructor]